MVKIYIIIIALCAACPLLYSQKEDTITEEFMITFIEQPPVFKGDLISFIKENLKYPECAQNDTLEGTVVISYWIDTTGFTVEHHIIKGLRKDFDEEAMKVVRLIRYERPAMQRGKPIRVKYTVPIEFKRENLFQIK